jgi:hypothetical protein
VTGCVPADGEPESIAWRSKAGRWVLGVAIVGSGMAFLDSTIVNVALPAIGRDFDASTSSLRGSGRLRRSGSGRPQGTKSKRLLRKTPGSRFASRERA